MPIGSIIPYAGSSVPTGYLECDGTAVSRTTYAELFAVIGTSYGVGDGNTTFNLPDMVGRVPMGTSSGHAIGTTGGEETHALDTTEIPSHSHTVPEHTHANTIIAKTPQFTHSITQPSYTYTQMNNASASAGGGSQVTRYTSKTSAGMSRSTNFAVGKHSAAGCTKSGAITDCAALTAGNAGSGTAHNNMMPYLALTYLICASE